MPCVLYNSIGAKFEVLDSEFGTLKIWSSRVLEICFVLIAPCIAGKKKKTVLVKLVLTPQSPYIKGDLGPIFNIHNFLLNFVNQ